ncbi:hypothetical protein HY415_02210 [Candidatus Kaiserbacteria bacterium]|nr:hypothetical protein [Candidatus Kaiserbacteria bacterium]
MEDEKLLPKGEEGIEVTALPVLQSYATASKPLPKPDIPPTPSLPGVPSAKAQSWGTVVSIIVIVLMIVIGAFYAWGQRIAQNQIFTAPTEIAQ